MLILVGAAVVSGIVAVSISRGGRGPRLSTPKQSSIDSPPSRAASTPSPSDDRFFAVGVVHMTFLHRDQSVNAGDPAKRSLPTAVWYPAVGSSSRAPIRRAQVADSTDPFPLVVFAHGFDLYPSTYLSLITSWARAGYVVAAPVFPYMNPGAQPSLNREDLVNQPGDVSSVIDGLLRLRGRELKLGSAIDPSRIALAGHSDGGDTVLASGYANCCRDPRIDAVVVMAGQKLLFRASGYFPRTSPPLLAIQGTADSVNPPVVTSRFYTQAPNDKYLLLLRGGDHLTPYTSPGPTGSVVRNLSIQFLDRYVTGNLSRRIHLPESARDTEGAILRWRVAMP